MAMEPERIALPHAGSANRNEGAAPNVHNPMDFNQAWPDAIAIESDEWPEKAIDMFERGIFLFDPTGGEHLEKFLAAHQLEASRTWIRGATPNGILVAYPLQQSK